MKDKEIQAFLKEIKKEEKFKAKEEKLDKLAAKPLKMLEKIAKENKDMKM